MGFQISSGLYRSVTNKCLRLPGSLWRRLRSSSKKRCYFKRTNHSDHCPTKSFEGVTLTRKVRCILDSIFFQRVKLIAQCSNLTLLDIDGKQL